MAKRSSNGGKWGAYVSAVYRRFQSTGKIETRCVAGVGSGMQENEAKSLFNDPFFRNEAMRGGHPAVHVVGPKFHRVHLVVM